MLEGGEGFYKRVRAEIGVDAEEVWREPEAVRQMFDGYHTKLIEEIKRQRRAEGQDKARRSSRAVK